MLLRASKAIEVCLVKQHNAIYLGVLFFLIYDVFIMYVCIGLNIARERCMS